MDLLSRLFIFSPMKENKKFTNVFTQNISKLVALKLKGYVQKGRISNFGRFSKQVSPPNISLILQKMKIAQNSIYALFARSPSISNVPTKETSQILLARHCGT